MVELQTFLLVVAEAFEEPDVGEALIFWVPLRRTSRGCLLWVVYSVVNGSPPRGINS